MGSYDYPPLKKSNIHGLLSLWIAFTLDPFLGHHVVLSHQATLNESINDKYSSLIRESNPKDQLIGGRTSKT